MKALYDLKEMLSAELEEIARKPEMSAGDLETVHKLTDTIKNIDKICALEEDGGYSEAGDWEGDYGRGSSYANRGKHYVVAITPEMGVVVTAVTGGWADIAGMMPKRP